jgi:hypothetical protein
LRESLSAPVAKQLAPVDLSHLLKWHQYLICRWLYHSESLVNRLADLKILCPNSDHGEVVQTIVNCDDVSFDFDAMIASAATMLEAPMLEDTASALS